MLICAIRSVHNIRIERLWVDFTRGIGGKWRLFFEDLESTGGLDVDSDEHVWLLHYLFLDDLNCEILEWAEVWNNHKITTPGLEAMSPKALKLQSITLHGIRGILEPIPEDEVEEYGIDWDAYEDSRIRTHHDRHNAIDAQGVEPLETQRPAQHTVVEVQEPDCPLDADQLVELQSYLQNLRKVDRKNRWILALAFCRTVLL